MRYITRQRVFVASGSVATIGAVATLVAGVTFGLFSAQQTSGTNTFTAGTVTLGQGATTTCAVGTGASASVTGSLTAAGTTVSSTSFSTAGQYVGWTITDTTGGHSGYIPSGTTITADGGSSSATMSAAATTSTAGDTLLLSAPPSMVPGDSSSGYGSGSGSYVPCTFTVTYSGDKSAWLALDVAVASAHVGVPVAEYSDGVTPAAAAGLYDSGANGLHLVIKDNQASPVTYMSGLTLNNATTTGAAPSATDLLVSTAKVANGQSFTFTVDFLLPTTATDAYQQAASTVTLTAHAVQADNNGSTSGCTAGLKCDTSVSASDPAWS